ncbi:alpha/beta fold hydrolase [Nonomuraea bangladeshensis]|uniref:alpha/beta fold hydrolase n=1 Tax=Nonomuraea bangladeshensis TaxID=404385 RepID=UPI0031D59629
MRWVESGDVRLAVYTDGDPADPTVLLLHGYPDTHRVWDEVAARLSGRFHVVRYDVRGAGASTGPRDRRDYGLDRLMDDLRAVLDAVAGGRKVHLVGHDWGSVQGWEAAGRAGLRERLASFTSLGGPGGRHLADFARHGGRRDRLVQLVRSSYIGFFLIPVLPELAWRSLVPRLLARRLRREGAPPRDGHPAPTLVRDARNGLWLYRANLRGRRGRAEPAGPPVIDLPVQLVDAAHDPFVTSALAGWCERWTPRLRRRELDAGHWAQRARPDTVAGMIAEFVAHVEGASPSRELRPQVDVGNVDQMADFSRNVIAEYGVPDIVLNNAGITVAGPILDHTVDDWRRTIDTNLWGVIHGCRLFGAAMVARGQGGHIVNVASLAASAPTRLLPAYFGVQGRREGAQRQSEGRTGGTRHRVERHPRGWPRTFRGPWTVMRRSFRSTRKPK